jgi:ribA/ribD-fused uncharacterized protein
MGGPAWINGEPHDECDNFNTEKPFLVDGIEYPSAEHYFQAMKNDDPEYRERVLSKKNGLTAWVEGSKCKLRKDWEEVKVDIMYEGNAAKLAQHKELTEALVNTGNAEIKFTSSTDFWNKWNGKIFERIRAELRGTEEDLKLVEELKSEMEVYRDTHKRKQK